MDLTPLMKPKSVAVVGASPRMNRATRVITNLQRFGYGGRIFPINPRHTEIHGLPCYPDLASTPEPADTVVVAIPAEQVPAVLTAAVERGVRGAVVLSSGFGEAGPAGQARQATVERLAAERGLLVCGPNCYGVFNIRLAAATFSADMRDPLAGSVAVVSQSGGFSHAIAEHLMVQRRVGLSYIVSCGNQAGVTVEDYVEFLVDDEDTAVIGVFVEGFKQPDKLRRVAARAREMRKPIVALKVGRSQNARQAMLAHTGSLAGTPEIIEAMLRQSGIVQVTSLNEMLDTLALMPAVRDVRRPGGARTRPGGARTRPGGARTRPGGARTRPGWRTAVLSGLGGECGRVADVADREGIELPPLSPASIDALRAVMPDFGNPRNPLDGTGAMYESPAIFPALVDTLLRDETIDVLAVNMRANVPRPGGWAPSREFARVLEAAVRKGTDRLVFCFGSHAAGDLDQDVVAPLAEAGVPYLEATETAMQALRHAREYHRFLARPPRPPLAVPGATSTQNGHGVLTNAEAMRLLREFGIPLAETLTAADADTAVKAAERVGYPVALKIDSPDVVHKTDVGGVRVGCGDAASVRAAFSEIVASVRAKAPPARIDGVLVQPMIAGGTEMILGVKSDPLFGPAVVCGFGGIFVEVLHDVSLRVPPLDAEDAREMIGELRGAGLLLGVRGRPPSDVAALAAALVRLAALAETHRDRLRGLDLNPLVVLDEGRGVVAVDWLIELA